MKDEPEKFGSRGLGEGERLFMARQLVGGPLEEVYGTGRTAARRCRRLRWRAAWTSNFPRSTVAGWFDLFMAFYSVSKGPERDYIRVHEEPDWNRMAAEAGTTADVEAWRDWMNRLLEEEEPGKVEA